MQKLFRSLIAIGGLAGLAACGDDVSVTPPADPLIITGAPVTSVQVGAKIQLSTNRPVTWTSSASNVASVDGTGLVTAAAAGTASITATSTADVNDKASVTITVTAPAVRSVTVSPNAVTMNPGGTQGFVANVDADPGVARTVTWASTNTAVVTVTSAGVATAVAPGAATITATSTVATSVVGAAAVTVRTPTAATVTIDRVTVGNTNTPVNFLAVVGQMDVSVNVDPGDFVLSKVELLIDGVVCPGCTQSFTAEQSEALSAAAVYGDSIAGAVSNILFSVQTSLFDTTTGVPSWKNTEHTVSARATLTNAGQTSTASSNRNMTFANMNTWLAKMAFTGTTASATGTSGTSAGLAYRRGGITVTVLPVIYNNNQSIVSAGGVVTFGSNACDAFSLNGGSSGGIRNVSLTGTGPFTAEFPQARPGNSTATRVNSVENYEFSSAACGSMPGETPILTAVDNNGNNVFAAVAPCIPPSATLPAGSPAGQFCPANSQAFVRLDNNAPSQVTPPQFNANPNRRLDGWVNANINLNAFSSNNNPNGWTINGSADNGVGGGSITSTSYLKFIRIGDGTDGTVNAARAATAAGSYTAPAPTLTNSSLCAILTVRDELGNETSRPSTDTPCLVPNPGWTFNTPTGTTHLRFGVDIAPPVAAYDVSSLPDMGRISGGSMGSNFTLTVSDTGTVGNSGMLAGNALVARVVRREADGTILSTTPGPTDCVVGSLNSSETSCSMSATGGAGTIVALPLVSANVSAQTIAGYYTFDGTISDAAGNTTPAPGPTRVVAYDNTPATATAPAVPATITGSFSAASFLNDNLSIRDYFWTASYATPPVPAGSFRLSVNPTVVDAFNAATLSNVNFGINNVVTTWLNLQDGTTTPPTAYVANSNALTGLQILVRDQTQTTYSASPVAVVAPTAPATGVSVTNWTGAFTNTNSGTGTLCALAAASGGCVANNTANDSTSVTLRATATGTTAIFNNPFSRLDFYGFNGTEYVLIGTVTAPTLVDNGATRVFTWTLPSVSANTLFTLLGGVSGGAPGVAITRAIYAIGSNSTGLVGMISGTYNLTINP
jgi:hypothetical protein